MPTRKLTDFGDGTYLAKPCLSPEHEPPAHMVYEDGIWEHVCPLCGSRKVWVQRQPIW